MITGLEPLDQIIAAHRQFTQAEPPTNHNNLLEDEAGPEHLSSDDFDDDYIENTRSKLPPLVINIVQCCETPRHVVSALLHHITIYAVLPQALGGREEAVVLIDCTNTLSVSDLYQTMISQARTADANHIVCGDVTEPDVQPFNLQATEPDTIENVVQDAEGPEIQHSISPTGKVEPNDIFYQDTDQPELQQSIEASLEHVHLISCLSTSELLTALNDLPTYLFSGARKSGDRILDTIIIHGLNHFYLQDRQFSEIARLEAGHVTSNNQASHSVINQIMKQLEELQSLFDCTLVYTSNPEDLDYFRGEEQAIDIYKRSALISVDVTEKDTEAPQFSAEMDLDECDMLREQPQEDVQAEGYSVSVTAGGISEANKKMGEKCFEIYLDDSYLTVNDELETLLSADLPQGQWESLEMHTCGYSNG